MPGHTAGNPLFEWLKTEEGRAFWGVDTMPEYEARSAAVSREQWGFAKGYAKGFAKGFAKSVAKGKRKIAHKAFVLDLPFDLIEDLIEELTGLPACELRAIEEEVQRQKAGARAEECANTSE